MFGGAKEKVDIGIVCGSRVLASDRLISLQFVLIKFDVADRRGVCVIPRSLEYRCRTTEQTWLM